MREKRIALFASLFLLAFACAFFLFFPVREPAMDDGGAAAELRTDG